MDQGGGKRKGSFAIYLEPWHADIFDFLDLRKVSKEKRDGGMCVWMDHSQQGSTRPHRLD